MFSVLVILFRDRGGLDVGVIYIDIEVVFSVIRLGILYGVLYFV